MKKYYKFIFMALFGLFIFLPKDTFALGIGVYDTSGAEVGRCQSCTSIFNCDDQMVTRNFVLYFGDEYNFYPNYTYEIDVNLTFVARYNNFTDNGNPALCYGGVCPNLSVNNYVYGQFKPTQNYCNNGLGIVTYVQDLSYNATFTTTIQGSKAYIDWTLVQPRPFVGIVVRSITIKNISDGTGAIINNATSSIIINDNNNTQKIIESNGEIKKEQEKTNEELGKLNDNLTSEEAPDLDALEDSAGWLPPGPVDSILNLPLTFFNNLISNLSKTCQPVNIPLPYVSKNLTLPCISTLYEQIGATTFLNWVGLIVGTIILYNYFLNLYKWIDDTIQMKDNSVDDWGGV